MILLVDDFHNNILIKKLQGLSQRRGGAEDAEFLSEIFLKTQNDMLVVIYN